MSLLSQQEISSALRDLSGWQLDGKILRKEFIFPTFADVMVFINEVAQAAEDIDHHPDIDIRHNTVRLATTTFDLAGITGKDIDLAKRAQDVEKSVFGELNK